MYPKLQTLFFFTGNLSFVMRHLLGREKIIAVLFYLPTTLDPESHYRISFPLTTTSKVIFQFLAGVSFVFVVWNPIFCMLFPVHIVLNIGGIQARCHKNFGVSGHIFLFLTLFSGWKTNQFVTKAALRQPLNEAFLFESPSI